MMSAIAIGLAIGLSWALVELILKVIGPVVKYPAGVALDCLDSVNDKLWDRYVND